MFSESFKNTLEQIDKEFSKGTVFMLGDDPGVEVKRISSGRLCMDIPFGGGVPVGRIIEFYGGESSGKTTAAIHMIAAHQQHNKGCAFVDYEHAFDPEYARNLGVDTDKLVFTQPTYAEQGLSIIEKLIDTKEVGLIVVDSVAAMLPKSELEGDMGDSRIGVHARLMSQAMRKIAGKAYKNGTTIVFINQTREKIGVMFGNPTTTAGGNALKFYASIRVEFYRGSKKEDKGEAIFNRGKLKVVKNKTFPPYKDSEYDLEYGKGMSKEAEIVDYGVEFGIIDKSGSWYSYDGTKIGQGKESVKSTLQENPELYEELFNKIKQVIL